ncbi:Maf family protein [Piscinibacter sakaiensis]|uniref:Maf family protein n=1 Tax=Piscinibacter sakaiensis TaxID=1547922 RepID=UPI0037270A84
MPRPRPLILASTSVYRRELLSRLRLPFEVQSPGTDETPRPGETPAALAERLALAKAAADAVVIGSDQVADLDGRALGKPGGHAAAVAQLQAMRGRSLVFQTAVAVLCREAGYAAQDRVPVEVRVRDLSDAEIDAYLRLEPAYDCAGSARSESLGIVLMEAIRSDDATALVGLPLIRTAALLRGIGLDPLR